MCILKNKRKIIVFVIFILLIVFFHTISPYCVIRIASPEAKFRFVRKDITVLEFDDIVYPYVYTDCGFYNLEELTNVKIECNKWTNIKKLNSMKKIEKLSLRISNLDSDMQNEFLNEIPLMENVTELTIVGYEGEVVSENSQWCKRFPNIEVLSIYANELNDISGVSNFGNLKELLILDLQGRTEKRLDISSIKELNKLQRLDITGPYFKAPDTAVLAQCETISWLRITAVNPMCDLENITQMKSLKDLYLTFKLKDDESIPIVSLNNQQIEFLTNLDTFTYSNFELSDKNGIILDLQKHDD